jgi:hypothetical protein
MSKLAPLPEWPAGRKHMSVKEMAELAAQWRYGPCADPPPPLAIDMSQCDFETVVQIYAMDHQARENHKSVCRRRDLEIVTFGREILALASQLDVRLRRPTVDTPAFYEPDESFVVDEEGFRKITRELLDPLRMSDNSTDVPETTDRSTASESEPTADRAVAVAALSASEVQIKAHPKPVSIPVLAEFLKGHGQRPAGELWAAAQNAFPHNTVPRDTVLLPAIDKAFPGRLKVGRPKSAE